MWPTRFWTRPLLIRTENILNLHTEFASKRPLYVTYSAFIFPEMGRKRWTLSERECQFSHKHIDEGREEIKLDWQSAKRDIVKACQTFKMYTKYGNEIFPFRHYEWLRGAMVARLTPDQKVACSNHVGVSIFDFFTLLGPIYQSKESLLLHSSIELYEITVTYKV